MAAGSPFLHVGAPLERASVLCVLVHGRGQTPEEMVKLVVDRVADPTIGWLLPRADGKSWYAARAVDPLTPDTREDLNASLDLIAPAINTARATGRPVVLAGFSQGACLAIEYLCRAGAVVDGLIALTGARVGVLEDDRPRARLTGMPAYLTGGEEDPWIPVTAFAEAVAELGGLGARLRADLFPGREHIVSDPEIAVMRAILGTIAAGAPPLEAA